MIPFSSIPQAIEKLDVPWSPLELARVNDHVVNIAKFEGVYPGGFHTHEFDEFFFVYSGEITIQMKGRDDCVLREGEIGVVPKGVLHCPKSGGESVVVMVEKFS